MPHLLVDISAHGYGHLAQAGPVLESLFAAVPGLELTVRSGLPRECLARRIAVPFRHVHATTDFGYVMHNALDLDLKATGERYRNFHRDWNAKVAGEAEWLRQRHFDAVLANVAYLPLAGAARAGIPAFAMCSLNWADLFRDNFGKESWAPPIYAEMLSAYRCAATFLRVTPGMPMSSLANVRVVGPICRMRAADRPAVARRLQIDAAERWLLVAMGGIDFPIDMSQWPRHPGMHYLVPSALALPRSDMTAFAADAIDFTELLAVVDVVLTKPGYGTFVEAACHGRPVLYVPRGNWAEEKYLIAWLRENTRTQALGRERLLAGQFMEAVEALLARPAPHRPVPSGIAEAVEGLAEMCEAFRR